MAKQQFEPELSRSKSQLLNHSTSKSRASLSEASNNLEYLPDLQMLLLSLRFWPHKISPDLWQEGHFFAGLAARGERDWA